MKREALVRLLVLMGLVLSGWWMSVATEWVDEDRPRPVRGEARDNPAYATEQLLRRLGMQVRHLDSLPQMPPQGARLLLLASDWALFPERSGQLQQWVMGGGHLVLLQPAEWMDTPLAGWVPVVSMPPKAQPAPASAASPASATSADDDDEEVEDKDEAAEPPLPAASATLEQLAERNKVSVQARLTSTPPLWGDTEQLETCMYLPWSSQLQVRHGVQTSWLVTRKDSIQLLRMPAGRGSVTVLNTHSRAFFNEVAVECDNPLLIAAALQAEPGATAWIYLNEKRQALLPWLWQQGWIAIVLGLLALAAALWRGAVRFGPRLAAPPRLRRSIAEQVRGLGDWLHREGPEALLIAQQRALGEAALRMLPGHGRLTPAEQARAIAEATQLPCEELSAAMAGSNCTRAQLPRHLQVLESARRRLLKTQDERQLP